MLAILASTDTAVRPRRLTRERTQMLHWKVKLAHLGVIAALLAAFLSDLEGWAW